ncbi:MAG: phage virion morphogenesis protein [Candidatus Methanospirareceae archaeon]
MTIKDTNKIPTLLNEVKDEKERILRKAGAFMEGAIKDTITKGKPDSEWPRLQDATIRRKTIRGKKGDKKLMDTGAMRNSVTHKVESDKDRVLVGIFRASAEVGENITGEEAVNIAAVHEFGSPKRGIPKRSFIRSTFDEKKDEAEKLIEKEVNKMLTKPSK